MPLSTHQATSMARPATCQGKPFVLLFFFTSCPIPFACYHVLQRME